MDWEKIEREVQLQTKSLVAYSGRSIAGSGYKPSRRLDASEVFSDLKSVREKYSDISSQENAFGSRWNENVEMQLEGLFSKELNEVKEEIQQHGRRTATLEKMLGSYSEILESSSTTQAFVSERVEQMDKEMRNSLKFVMATSRDKSELQMQIKTLAGKVEAFQQHVSMQEVEYASKEAFAKLLDSTVDQIRGVDVALANTRLKAAQAASLVEALILAIHMLKRNNTHTEDDSPNAMNMDFILNYTG
jgi:chromosome segregation ATPase